MVVHREVNNLASRIICMMYYLHRNQCTYEEELTRLYKM